ncbi:unnamed protein product [Heterobilharzia americana]|nr:unnamed protein product [Heterobilharzia americana]
MSDAQCVDQKSSGSDSSSTGEEERLKKLFLSCDSNNDGCLDCEDLYDMCRKLNMAECAEEIINTLGANTKGRITFDEFLSCREKVFQMQTEADPVYFSKADLPNYQVYKHCEMNWHNCKSDRPLDRILKGGHTKDGGTIRKLHENTNLGSSASENSLVNSGAEYDSGAQDLCGEPQSLHILMQRDFADLYRTVFSFQTNSNVGSFENIGKHKIPDDSIQLPACKTLNDDNTKSCRRKELANTTTVKSKEKSTNLERPIKTESSEVQTIRAELNPYFDHVRHLFECANTLHVQRTAQLRSEIRDLSHRLQGLQTSRVMSCREIQRLQKEKEQLRTELTNQVSRYEDRLTELHSVIAELRRRLEHSETNVIHEEEEFEENEDADEDDNDNNDGSDIVSRSESEKKSEKRRLSNNSKLLIISNNQSTDLCDEYDKDESGNSDASVDAIMDGDDDDDINPNSCGSDHDEGLDKYGEIGRKCQNSHRPSKNFGMHTNFVYDQFNRNYNLSSRQLSHHLSLNKDGNNNNTDITNTTTADNNNNNDVYISSNINGISKNYNHDLCIKYETILSNMQTQLNCVIQERDMLASQLNTIMDTTTSSINTTTATPAITTTTTILTEDSSLVSTPKSNSILHPVMGVNRSAQMKSTTYNNNNNNSLHPNSSINGIPTTSIQQLQYNQQNLNLSNLITYNTTNSSNTVNSSGQINHDKLVDTIMMTTQPIATTTTSNNISEQMNSNVYDLPEPEWITCTLKKYHEYSITHSKQNITSGLTVGSCSSATTTTSEVGGIGCVGGVGGGSSSTRTGGIPLDYEQSLFDHISSEDIIIDSSDEMTMNLPGQFSPNALMILLSSLAQLSPYPRLTEAAQCGQLTWRRLLTTLARYRSDCLVLQANLAEIKSNADQMQCQLNQIEANWSVIFRAMQMSEAALEVSDCLNQLYSTELAVTIYRQTQKLHLPKHPFSTISSSTSSSSFHGHIATATSTIERFSSQPQSQPFLPTTHTPSSPYQAYAVVPLSNSFGSSEEHDLSHHHLTNGQQIPSVHLSLNTLKSFRQQAEFLAYTMLDRYETSDGGYEKILPTCIPNQINTTTTTTAGGVNITAPMTSVGGAFSLQRASNPNHNQHHHQHPSQSPVSPGLFSMQSAITSSNSLLDNNSVYANSWYVSLNRSRPNPTLRSFNEIGEQFQQQQQQQQQIPSMTNVTGSIPSVNYHSNHQQQNVRSNGLNNSLQLINPQIRSFLKPHSQINTNQNINNTPGNIAGGGGGWETPDSGAGSSSINEVSSQNQQSNCCLNPPFLLSSSSSSLLFGHFYQIYGINNYNTTANTNMDNNNNNNKLNGQSDSFVSHSLLDNLPPLWTFLSKSSTSFYESDLDSSDSSDSRITPSPTPTQENSQLHNPNHNTSNSNIHLSNWSRLEERKLRTVYCQLIQTYKRLKSMLIDIPNLDMFINIDGVVETSSISYGGGDNNIGIVNSKLSTTIPSSTSSMQQRVDSDLLNRLNQSNSAPMNSLRKLPLAVLLENSVLLQELCCVKEECADLKVRVYLLEKELCANRLTLESRAAAERALRAHLDALIIEQQQQQHSQPTNDQQKDGSTIVVSSSSTTITNQSMVGINHHETALLRGQVKNLLQALEALRSSTEIQQVQSEELVDDLKRANSALITAFEKAKRKYMTRIKKLEDQLTSIQKMSSICINSSTTCTSIDITTTSHSSIPTTAYHHHHQIARTTLNPTTMINTTAISSINATPLLDTTVNNNGNTTTKGYTRDYHHQLINMAEISNTTTMFNDANNFNSNHSQVYPIQPMKSGFVSSYPTMNSTINYNRDLTSNPMSPIPPPMQQQQQQSKLKQTKPLNTPKCRSGQLLHSQQSITVHPSSSTTTTTTTTTPSNTLSQFINSKNLPPHPK